MTRPRAPRLVVAILTRMVAALVVLALIGGVVVTDASPSTDAVVEVLEDVETPMDVPASTPVVDTRAPERAPWLSLASPAPAPTSQPPVPPPRA